MCYRGDIVERKEDNLHLTVLQYLTQEFGGVLPEGYRVTTHGVPVDSQMSLKELLEDWNYNDGFCYLLVE